MQNTKPKIYPYHEAWAVKNGYRQKATSHKQQAASAKQQAPSTKLQALKNIFESLLDPGPRISNRVASDVALGPQIMDLGSWNKFQAPLTEGLE